MRILARVQNRHEQLTQQLTHLPDNVLPALAQRIAIEEDPRVVALAFAIFGKNLNNERKLPADVLETLKKAKLPAVADLANQR